MSGHSKWKNILHKKEKTDAQRAKVFTKIGREMAVAVREGGPDPNSNSKLKDCIAKAKANNVPNDNIKRIIERASGADGANYETIVYEGYGPSGVAVIVETLTENRNRTASDMRHYFDKFGGNMGASGCVSWQFDAKGVIVIEKEDIDEELLLMSALEAGAEDMKSDDEVFEIICPVSELPSVRDALSEKYTIISADEERIPQTYIALSDEEDIKNMEKLLDALEDNDDVQNVWNNLDE